MSQTIKTPKQQFYLAKLLGFDYDIQYKARTSNVVADSLSRIDSSTQGQYFVLSIPHHEFMIQLRETLSASSEFQKQCEAIQAKPEDHHDFFILGDFILFKGAIWIDTQNPFILVLLHEYHAAPIGGHFGVKRRYIASVPTSNGPACSRTSRHSSVTAVHVNKLNISRAKVLDCSNLFRYPPASGKTSPWISSHTFRVPTGSQLFSWSLIGSPREFTLVPYLLTLRRSRWLTSSSILYASSTGFLVTSFPIAIRSLLAPFGENYFD